MMRDPRTDPRARDIIRRDGALRSFEVDEVVDGGDIIGRYSGGKRTPLCSLTRWRDVFARDARVIHTEEVA